MVVKFALLVKYMILILGTVENDMQLCLDTILFLTIQIFNCAGLSKLANCHWKWLSTSWAQPASLQSYMYLCNNLELSSLIQQLNCLQNFVIVWFNQTFNENEEYLIKISFNPTSCQALYFKCKKKISFVFGF